MEALCLQPVFHAAVRVQSARDMSPSLYSCLAPLIPAMCCRQASNLTVNSAAIVADKAGEACTRAPRRTVGQTKSQQGVVDKAREVSLLPSCSRTSWSCSSGNIDTNPLRPDVSGEQTIALRRVATGSRLSAETAHYKSRGPGSGRAILRLLLA